MSQDSSEERPVLPPQKPGKRNVLVLVIVAVLVVAGLGVGIYVILSRPATPAPSGPTVASVQLAVESGTTTVDQSATPRVTAVVKDSDGKVQTANATFVWTASPSSAAEVLASNVRQTVTVHVLKSGALTITANATWNNSSKAGTLAFTVTPISFQLTPSNSNPVIGSTFDIKLRVFRSDQSVFTGYTGTVAFTSDDPAATLPANRPFTFTDGGFADFPNIVVRKAGAVVIAARDTVAAVFANATVNGDHRPTAVFVITPSSPSSPHIAVDATGSSDPDTGDTLTYAWQFGDAGTGTGAVVDHNYTRSGTYSVNLTVTDNHGASNGTSQSYVVHLPPVASFRVQSESQNGPNYIELWANASASAAGEGSIAYYNWTWGDGNQTEVAGPLAAHNYSMYWNATRVTITLRVGNSLGFTGSLSKTVLVAPIPPPPVAEFTSSWSVGPVVDRHAYRNLSVDATSSYSPGGQLIAYYNWSWGDGSPNTNVTAPLAHHLYAADGTYAVNLTVVDSSNQNGSVVNSIVILVAPSAPHAAFAPNRTRMIVVPDANASWDPNNDIAYYNWTWGDGTPNTNSTNAWAFHDYTAGGQGVYTITLTVIDATGRKGAVTHMVTVASTTIDYTYSDFFNVPYGEWWDYRLTQYGDLPIGANCFNAKAHADGACVRNNPSVPAAESYPYTNWYPLPGALAPGQPGNNPTVNAPYRISVRAANVPNYTITQPVLLPTCTELKANLSTYPACPSPLPAGDSVNVSWDMQYLDLNSAHWVDTTYCSSTSGSMDGFVIMSNITLSMDLATASRIFGTPSTSPAAAATWWGTYRDSTCGLRNRVSAAFQNWLSYLGGSSSKPGPYDIFNSYQYYYSPFMTWTNATVDSTTGQTTVKITHVAWGTEALLARLFYWGNAAYSTNFLDSTKANGWWGMELAWFEDFHFNATIGSSMDFTLSTVMQYSFQETSLPGPDGVYRGDAGELGDDIPIWTWQPILSDYAEVTTAAHPYSELSRYPSPYYGYVHTTPGSITYNQNLTYDYVPLTWNLKVGQTWHFQFPSGNVVFHDPNLTPLGAIPYNSSQNDGYVAIHAPFTYRATMPGGYGIWDAANMTWDVIGPASTGGPRGTPGADGTPGTSDDQYAIVPWGSISFADPPAPQGSQFMQTASAGASVAPSLAAQGPDIRGVATPATTIAADRPKD